MTVQDVYENHNSIYSVHIRKNQTLYFVFNLILYFSSGCVDIAHGKLWVKFDFILITLWSKYKCTSFGCLLITSLKTCEVKHKYCVFFIGYVQLGLPQVSFTFNAGCVSFIRVYSIKHIVVLSPYSKI